MKRFFFVAVIALMCFGTNAFSKELPEALARFGVHFGIGTTGYWDYPPQFLVGSDDWGGVAVDLGGVFKLNINETVNFLLELNLGLNATEREISQKSTRHGVYSQVESRTIYKLSMPLLLRIKPLDFLFVDAGVQFNSNLASFSGKEYKDEKGNSIASPKADLVEWKVKGETTSLVFGLSLGNHMGELGARFVLDMDRIHKNDKIVFYDDGDEIYLYDDYVKQSSGNKTATPFVTENKTKIWSLQFVVNYYIK